MYVYIIQIHLGNAFKRALKYSLIKHEFYISIFSFHYQRQH